jgi:alpha-glucosidase
VPDRAPALGSTVPVFVRTPSGVDTVHVRSTPDGEPHFDMAVVDSSGCGVTWWRAEVEVRNPLTRYRFLLDGRRWLTALGEADHDVPDAFDFRLVAHDPPPAWAAGAVVYEIFPDRFARSPTAADRAPPAWAIPCGWDTPVVARGSRTPRQFYGGDLDGVAARLDHVASLGADTLYLTPFFPAGSNHRYDASAFDRVDPLLGGDEALGRLADAVHRRGMRLLGDLTTNHCGTGHPWFTADRDLFYFTGDSYESWLGVGSLPKFNWTNAELCGRFFDGPSAVATRWLGMLDGWRVDVANMTGRCGADDLARDVARRMRRAVAGARPDALLIAEHAHDASGDLDADGWHGTMNYTGFTRPLWTWLRADDSTLPDFLGVPGGVPRRPGPAVVAAARMSAALVSWRALTASWNLLGSHDTPRIRTVVGDAARQEVAAGLLMTLPGTPMIFAGDEFGLTGENGEGSRTPMPWHRPDRCDAATLGRYRALGALRRGPLAGALRGGGLRWLHVSDDALAFVREGEVRGDDLLVYARRAPGDPVRLPGLPGRLGLSGAENLYGGAADLTGDGPTFQVWRV